MLLFTHKTYFQEITFLSIAKDDPYHVYFTMVQVTSILEIDDDYLLDPKCSENNSQLAIEIPDLLSVDKLLQSVSFSFTRFLFIFTTKQ